MKREADEYEAALMMEIEAAKRSLSVHITDMKEIVLKIEEAFAKGKPGPYYSIGSSAAGIESNGARLRYLIQAWDLYEENMKGAKKA